MICRKCEYCREIVKDILYCCDVNGYLSDGSYSDDEEALKVLKSRSLVDVDMERECADYFEGEMITRKGWEE